jgi:hypothetical protein
VYLTDIYIGLCVNVSVKNIYTLQQISVSVFGRVISVNNLHLHWIYILYILYMTIDTYMQNTGC